MFCCTLLYVHSRFVINLIGNRELVALLRLPSWCLMIVVWLFIAVPWVGLQFVILVFLDHNHLLFFIIVLPNTHHLFGSDVLRRVALVLLSTEIF